MSFPAQLRALVALGVKSLPQRPGSSFVAVIGIASVVAVLLGMLSLSDSLARAISTGSRADRAIVMSRGAQNETGSAIAREAIAGILDTPGIRRSDGVPIASAELQQPAPVREKSNGLRTMVIVRGVSPSAFLLRPEVRLVEGRMIREGLYELLVGANARARYAGLEIGDTVKIRNNPFVIVGAFASDGNLRESELFTDTRNLLSIRPRAKLSSVTVQLESADTFNAFRDALEANPTLAVSTIPEPEYARRLTGEFTALLELIGYLVGAIMAAAATFGAANTMYTAVSARSVELATLRAIGFGPGAVVSAILLEALLLALIGAGLGAALVTTLVNGETFNSGTLSTQLHIDSRLAAIGIGWACAIAILGGLFPALKAARMPIASALRES